MLIDDFGDGVPDPARWSQSYGDPVEQGGRLRVPCTTGYAGARTASMYTLSWSQVSARVYPPMPGGASTAALSFLVLSDTGGTDAGFLIDPAQSAIGLYSRVGYADGGAQFPVYDPEAHAWLRLREDAGSLHWEAAPDGRTWAVLRTAASPAWTGQANLSLLFEAHRDGGANDFAEIASLNITRPGGQRPLQRGLSGPGPYPRTTSTVRGA